jgi:hypothetical protein
MSDVRHAIAFARSCNETRELSLMFALRVNSGTGSTVGRVQQRRLKRDRSLRTQPNLRGDYASLWSAAAGARPCRPHARMEAGLSAGKGLEVAAAFLPSVPR